ncbi:MAG: nitrous oxide reductase accessory protein NosL [Burkholderiales bacterium]|nr:nitrous oxide reductase accessory protein NosL [Burkholderiales bacterium]
MMRGLVCVAVLALAACQPQQPVAPKALGADTVCVLDGMTLADYPGPKAQILYADGKTDFFCDTVEMFAMILQPEQKRAVRAVYTQDMGKEDWRAPRGNWIDARAAYYVAGSPLRGAMGPTFAAFAAREDAEAFMRKHGGKMLRFDDVTPEMADLRGGATRDERM